MNNPEGKGNLDESGKDASVGVGGSGIRLRGIVAGLILLVFMSYLTQGAEMITLPGSVQPPSAPAIGGLLAVLLLLIVNRITTLRRGAPVFTNAEITVCYIMLSVGVLAAGHGVVSFTVGSPALYYYVITRVNMMYRPVFDAMSPYVIIKDRDAFVSFLRGGSEVVPWGQWIIPLIVMTLFWTVFFFLAICIATVFRKRWSNIEHLRYPIMMPVSTVIKGSYEDIGIKGGSSLWKNKLTLVGMIPPILFGALRLLNNLFPAIPSPSGYIMISDFFTSPPFDILQSWPGVPFYYDRFLAMGIAYFLGLETTFSVWFSYWVFDKLSEVIQSGRGVPAQMVVEVFELSIGGLLGLALVLTWYVRHDIVAIVRVALGLEKSADFDDDEPLSFKTAFWGGLASFFFIMVFCVVVLKMSLWFTVFIYVFILANLIWFGRLRAEVGYPSNYAIPMGWNYGLYRMFKKDALGMNNAVGYTLYHVPHYSAYGATWMGVMLDNYKLGDLNGVKKRQITFIALLAFVVAIISGYLFALPVIYRHGFTQIDDWLGYAGDQLFWHTSEGRFEVQGMKTWTGIGIGFVLTVIVAILRATFVWFPLVPVAIPVAGLGMTRMIWGPFFVVWVIKFFIYRYGGRDVERKGRPFFMGLIFGEILMTIVGVCVGLVTRFFVL